MPRGEHLNSRMNLAKANTKGIPKPRKIKCQIPEINERDFKVDVQKLLIEIFNQGVMDKQIAAKLNCSESNIGSLRRKSTKKLSYERVRAIIEIHNFVCKGQSGVHN